MDPNYSNPVCDSIFNRTPRLRYYYSVNKLAISNYITNQIPNYKNMLSINIWNLSFAVRYNDSFTMQNIDNNNVCTASAHINNRSLYIHDNNV